ncbi:lipase family protein [Alcanivorax sediminis]|uniref:Triacylglycerol lipase n=1 Tax=Alcanivorax sediminis TaxID=2663008 RepID=A0A6N7LS71_9GAMM|nr:lipase family protein [Alcanivorax sediminis]MQX51855.1 Triacylglycerol lipase [Alcanivorax sediminis]
MRYNNSGFIAAAGLTSALLLTPLISHAAMTGPSDMGFYDPPVIAAGQPGELIWQRETSVDLGSGSPSVSAWNVLYHSTDAIGNPNQVTGTVLVPEAQWSGNGERPLISYAVGTHGLAQRCAPSLQMAQGTDYENANIRAALQAGYAVVITDNPGYTTGDTPSYMAGKAQAHAALDIIRASTQIADSGITPATRTAIWGYSQGGQTASWAGERWKDYAADINLVAVAAGGTPADFFDTAHYLNASTGSSFLLQTVIGLDAQYPTEIDLDNRANTQGKTEIAKVTADQCVFDTLFNYMNKDLAEYTVGNTPLDTLLAIPEVDATLSEQTLGNKRIDVPLYQYHGTADEFIPLDQHLALKQQYCRKFGNVTFGVFPSEHIVTQFQAATPVLSWLQDRMDGKYTLGTCLTLKPKPTANPNPGGGNFVVSLDQWNLDASMELATLGQTVDLPESSTFSADTDMTAGTLYGNLDVPDFSTKLNIVLPLDVKLSVVPSAPTTGTASLDNQGQLGVHGTAYADITVKSAGLGFLQIPFGCKTETPVAFPVNFDGPVSALGSGELTFTGTTSFPRMQGCGLFNSLFTSLMSGPGQQYSFNVAPPAPTTW